MKLLYVSQYFPPEIGAPAARVSELARHWAKNGHDVQVLTGFPNHPTGKVPSAYRGKLKRLVMCEDFAGARVTRTWLCPLPNRKRWERMANYASFAISAALCGLFLPRPEAIIGTSPQLLVGLAAWWLARIKRVPFIFEVRDLWPESLEAVGVGGEQTRLYRVLRSITRLLYARADHIVVVTPAFKDEIVREYGVSADRISLIPNGVETDLFDSHGPNQREPLGFADNFVVGYIGTMGVAHGLGTILGVAERMQTVAPRVRFLLVGEGAEKERVATSIAEMRLRNVSLLDGQPRENVAALIRSCDVCLVPLKRSEVFKTVVPTKMLEFMACGRPVIVAVEGQARQIIESAKAGLCIEPESTDQLAAAILELESEPAQARALGVNGREYIVKNLSREQTARDYERVLAAVTGRIQMYAAAGGTTD